MRLFLILCYNAQSRCISFTCTETKAWRSREETCCLYLGEVVKTMELWRGWYNQEIFRPATLLTLQAFPSPQQLNSRKDKTEITPVALIHWGAGPISKLMIKICFYRGKQSWTFVPRKQYDIGISISTGDSVSYWKSCLWMLKTTSAPNKSNL